MMTSGPGPHAALRHVRRIVDIEAEELPAALWSFGFFFCVLCAYYLIRPLRDDMGVTVGPTGLQWLFVIVFVVMLVAVPVFGIVVSALARRRVAPAIYAFFIANLIAFRFIIDGHAGNPYIAGAFFVWVSVFNLYVVSLFWSVMADLWSSDQAKRLYGFIAAGGSAGAFGGPLITQAIVHQVGASNLLLVSAMFLALAIFCAKALRRHVDKGTHAIDGLEPKPGATPVELSDTLISKIIGGAHLVAKSPYLRNIALWILLANLISTFFYLEQARIVGAVMPDRADRVQLFARVDLAVSVLTVLIQVTVAARIMERFGLGWSAASLPISSVLALLALAVSPTLAVIVTAIVVERALGFGLSNPAARVLYTVVSPEEKYKAQNLNDTVVFRGADAASGWVFNSLGRMVGGSVATVAILTLPLAVLWVGLSFRLGQEQDERARRVDAKPSTSN